MGGKLLTGASADWQIVLSDGTTLGDIRHTLQTDPGELLFVRSESVRHGQPAVLARLGRGENVDASECTFRNAGSPRCAGSTAYPASAASMRHQSPTTRLSR